MNMDEKLDALLDAYMGISQQLGQLESKLDRLLRRRKGNQDKKRKTKADEHDEAVANEIALGGLREYYKEAFLRWCEARKQARMYMTSIIVRDAINKLAAHPEIAAREACVRACAKPWPDVYPESIKIDDRRLTDKEWG